MQLTSTELTCPLCKHPVSANGGHSDPTRLCEDCRRIVQTIRSTNSPLGVIESPQARTTSQPQVAIGLKTECIQLGDANELYEEEIEAPIGEPYPLAFNSLTDAEPGLLDFDELFDEEPAIRDGSQDYLSESFQYEGVSQTSTLIADPMPEPITQPFYVVSGSVETPIANIVVAEAIRDLSDEIAVSTLEHDHLNACAVNSQSATEFFGDQALTGPTEEQAQHNFAPMDFPVLVRGTDGNKLARLRLPLAVALLAGSSVAGYFVIYRPSTQAPQSIERLSQQLGSARAGSQQPALQTKGEAEPGIVSAHGDTNSASAQAPNESLEGRYSLQAAAFPNEAGANDFCERLKRSGVPAYVVSAEIAGRGKWFRVRVGRFESTQKADRFASEARIRARASGLNLQLIVSSYDKP